jgi:uncharacterized protein YecE (DUF72 family)
LDKLLTFFKDIPAAVEFRNAEWLNNRVIDAFRERNIPLVALDMPSMKGLPPTLEVVTGPLVYIRLHGHNQGKPDTYSKANLRRYQKVVGK